LPQVGQEEAAAQEIKIVTFILSPHPYFSGNSKNDVRMK
jgi:alpha/beta superfamily hydrolase